MRRDGPKRDRAKIAFFGGLLALSFAWGLATAALHVFPYRPLHFAWHSTLVLRGQLKTLLGVEPTEFLFRDTTGGDGARTLAPAGAQPGWTLLSGFFDDGNELRLIDLDGTPIRRWPVRFSDLFPDAEHIQPASERPATDWNIDIHGAIALPDGSVVFNFEYGGLVKLDRCGDVVWTVPRMTHHFVTPTPEGELLVGGRRWVTDRSVRAIPLQTVPYEEDYVLRVSSTGTVIEELSVHHLLNENGLLGLLTANGGGGTGLPHDVVHLNDAEPLPDSLADRFPAFSAGDLLLSLRHLNLVLVMDPVSRRIKWRRTGPWIRQHDPDFTRNGTITVFDNRTDDTRRGSVLGGSRVLELQPGNGGIRTVYEGTHDGDFYTGAAGRHQNLGNGNLLLLEAEAGRVLEVDSAGRPVWEYINRYDATRVAFIGDAQRYGPEYFAVRDWSCP